MLPSASALAASRKRGLATMEEQAHEAGHARRNALVVEIDEHAVRATRTWQPAAAPWAMSTTPVERFGSAGVDDQHTLFRIQQLQAGLERPQPTTE